jgi:CheY-like chemotaxis protein
MPGRRGIFAFRQWELATAAPGDSEGALEALREAASAEDPYHFALLDYQMPGMDGAQLARVIKTDRQLRETVVLLLSSVSGRLETGHCESGVIDASLVKPVRQSRLLECLVEVMSASGAESAQPLGAEALPLPATQPPPPPRAAVGHIRILLAEDNVVNQRVAIKQLNKLGFSADAVANGLEVLSALQRALRHYNHGLPNAGNGRYEVTRRIRQSGSDSYIHLRAAYASR